MEPLEWDEDFVDYFGLLEREKQNLMQIGADDQHQPSMVSPNFSLPHASVVSFAATSNRGLTYSCDRANSRLIAGQGDPDDPDCINQILQALSTGGADDTIPESGGQVVEARLTNVDMFNQIQVISQHIHKAFCKSRSHILVSELMHTLSHLDYPL